MFQLSLTLLVMHSWIHHDHYRLEHANPSWFIPVVGNIIAQSPVLRLGYGGKLVLFRRWYCFLDGIINHHYQPFDFSCELRPTFKPMLFILLAPPSIGFVSYSSLVPELTDLSEYFFCCTIHRYFVGAQYQSISKKWFFLFHLGFFISGSSF